MANVRKFYAHQAEFGSQWLNVVPFKNLGLKLDDQQLRISIGFVEPICLLRIRATVVIESNGTVYTVFLAPRMLVATLNSLIKQTLGSLNLPSMEARGLYRPDGNSPGGVTMIPWEMGKHLVWNVTAVDALAPSRLNKSLLMQPGNHRHRG